MSQGHIYSCRLNIRSARHLILKELLRKAAEDYIMNFVHDRHSPFAMNKLRLLQLTNAHYIMNFVHDRHSPLVMNKLRLLPLVNAHYIIIREFCLDGIVAP